MTTHLPSQSFFRRGMPVAAVGAGLKPGHAADIFAGVRQVDFFEIHAENYMGAGGPPLRQSELRRIADDGRQQQHARDVAHPPHGRRQRPRDAHHRSVPTVAALSIRAPYLRRRPLAW